jgi:hypothetical protein
LTLDKKLKKNSTEKAKLKEEIEELLIELNLNNEEMDILNNNEEENTIINNDDFVNHEENVIITNNKDFEAMDNENNNFDINLKNEELIEFELNNNQNVNELESINNKNLNA